MPQQAVINPKTGFTEHPSWIYDFDSQRKLDFISLIRNGVGKYKACDLLKLKDATVFKHLRDDQAFADAVKQAERLWVDDLETISRQNATNPKMVIERIFQLKALLPEKYGDSKNNNAPQIVINIEGNRLEMSKKREMILDAKIVEDQHERVLGMSSIENNTQNQSKTVDTEQIK